jgi:hypothetical protein
MECGCYRRGFMKEQRLPLCVFTSLHQYEEKEVTIAWTHL